MSMFFCAKCDNLRDSDDGCEEATGNRLVCAECVDEIEEQVRGIKRAAPKPSPPPEV